MAATRADDRAHGVGRSRFTKPEDDAVFFELYDEDSAGWRPPCLGEPPVPQARVQRHTTEQMIESFVPAPILDLDAPVQQMVEQLVGVLKIFDNSLAEQVIEAPKITLQDRVPPRAALCLPQLVEQLVEVPVPSARDCVIKQTLSSVALARYTDAAGQTWCHCSGAWGLYWWLSGSTPEGVTASPGRYTNTGQVLHAQVPAVHADRYRSASDSVRRQSVGHPCYATETGTHSANCAEDADSTAQFLGRQLTRPLFFNDRCRVGSASAENSGGSAVAVLTRCSLPCCAGHRQGWDVPVLLQRQASGVPGDSGSASDSVIDDFEAGFRRILRHFSDSVHLDGF